MKSEKTPDEAVRREEGHVHLRHRFPLSLAGALREASVEYALVGSGPGPVVAVLGGISADRDASRWWRDVVGPGKPIDTRRFQVLGMDWLGTRSESFAPGPGSEPRAYPLISTEDQARALVALLDHLGLDQIHAIVGSSYGGMVGLSVAERFPGRTHRLVVISAAHRTHPMATAHRVVQRGILELAGTGDRHDDGVVLARALAMTTYRTVEEFEHRFATHPTGDAIDRFEVEDYLLSRGRAFRERFDARAFAALSHSIDLHRVDPRRITCPVHLISVDSDQLVPSWLMNELEEQLAGPGWHHRIPSPWGHDAFLKEADTVGRLVSAALEPTASRPRPTLATTTHQGKLHG